MKATTPKSFARRDHLREVEIRIQEKWIHDRTYEVNPDASKEKFFLTFPYPYMNGRLHLGHAFSGVPVQLPAYLPDRRAGRPR